MGWAIPARSTTDTRHNAGFLLADHLARRWGLGSFRRGDRARVAEGQWQGESVQLLKPQTYMNRSGAALAPLLALPSSIPPRDLLVLVDDVALPVGTVPAARRRLGRRPQRAQEHRGRAAAPGLRPAPDRRRAAARRRERPRRLRARALRAARSATLIDALLDPMADAVESWLTEGIERAMTRFNKGS